MPVIVPIFDFLDLWLSRQIPVKYDTNDHHSAPKSEFFFRFFRFDYRRNVSYDIFMNLLNSEIT